MISLTLVLVLVLGIAAIIVAVVRDGVSATFLMLVSFWVYVLSLLGIFGR